MRSPDDPDAGKHAAADAPDQNPDATGRPAEPLVDTDIDPDVDLRDPTQRTLPPPLEWEILGAIAVGGAVGALGRYGLSLALPHGVGAFPWSTVLTNAIGCLVLGAVMVVLLEVLTAHRLVRPFLGTGILGGFTTYSTFAVDAVRLTVQHRPLIALAYVATTLAFGAATVWIGAAGARAVLVRPSA